MSGANTEAGPNTDAIPDAAADKASAMEQVAIACDFSQSSDTPAERAAAYHSLFADALIARERTVAGVRWRFRAGPGVEPRIRDLAAKEQQCCAFFGFAITSAGGEVLWDMSVPADATARAILDEFYDLPDTIGEGTAALDQRFAARGLRQPLTG